MAASELTKALGQAVIRMLRPLVRILLRNGVPYGQFAELAKRAYVEVANDEFALPGRSQTTSRVSALTGLTRKEVQRLNRVALENDAKATAKYNRAARVIDAWISQAAYRDAEGRPRPLPLESDGPVPSFSGLVKDASGDITPRTILDELMHIGAVVQGADGLLVLRVRAYIPLGDDTEKIGILGTDVADLIRTIDHNLGCESGQAYFQRKVCYDNLPVEAMEQLRATLAQKAQVALESMNRDMARQDRDRHPEAGGSGRVRAGLGIFYFQHQLDDDGKE